ncbi:MAG: hypothetical protein ACYS5V_08510 [Planctomycetota bacterium]|jgi:hypothetical protein
MSTAKIDLGPLPTVAASVLLEYRKPNERATFRLGETTQSVSEWEINEPGTVELIATVRDKTGRLHRPGTTAAWSPQEAISPEPLPKDVTTWPGPVVTQDGPVLTVTPNVAPGLDPADYEMEVRVGSGAAKDALQIGFVAPGRGIDTHAIPGGQTIYSRAHRLEDGRMSDWDSTSFTVPTPIIDPTTDHTNDFASGTLETVGAGTAPLEINGGDLRHVAIYAGDLDGATDYAGDYTDVYAGDARLYWSPASYTTANIVLDVPEDIQVQPYHEMSATDRLATLYAGDCHWPAALPHVHADGSFHDPRVFECSLQNGADETPVVIDYKIATSASATPTFVDADFIDLVPGQVHSAVKTYAVRATVTTYLQKRFTIDTVNVRRWIWCRGRPWHSHSDAFELIHENTIAGSAVATYDISSVNGDDFDELMLQVLWKNDNAGATNLWLRPNNDSGANYDSDGGGGNEIIVGGGNTVAQNEWEDVRVRIHNPAQGVQRAFSIESNARWTATASDSSDAQESWLWTDTANEIATIRVLTAGGATTHLAVGTTTRLWGKRHHTE